MSRKKRIEIPGFYYIYNNSINKSQILKEDNDKNKFLEYLQKLSKQCNMKVHSYCITNTSYHLLVENSTSNLSITIKELNTLYSIYFSEEYKNNNILWQDTFKSCYIPNFRYLQAIYKYIETTPVYENLAPKVGTYSYSSSFMILNDTIQDYLKESFILKRFTRSELIEYFENTLTQDEMLIIQELKKEKVLIKQENYSKEKINSLYYIFKDVTSKEQRDHKIYYAFKKGYKQSEISNYLNLSHSSISKIILKKKNT